MTAIAISAFCPIHNTGSNERTTVRGIGEFIVSCYVLSIETVLRHCHRVLDRWKNHTCNIVERVLHMHIATDQQNADIKLQISLKNLHKDWEAWFGVGMLNICHYTCHFTIQDLELLPMHKSLLLLLLFHFGILSSYPPTVVTLLRLVYSSCVYKLLFCCSGITSFSILYHTWDWNGHQAATQYVQLELHYG